MTDTTKRSTGPNDRPRDVSIAGTAQGIPDEAATPGVEPPGPPSDDAVARVARALDAPLPDRED
jgi:hypothetical protein